MNRKEYKRHSWEFELEAVRSAALGEHPKAKIARELGIRVNQLRKFLEWRPHEQTIFPGAGSNPPTAGKRLATTDPFGKRSGEGRTLPGVSRPPRRSGMALRRKVEQA